MSLKKKVAERETEIELLDFPAVGYSCSFSLGRLFVGMILVEYHMNILIRPTLYRLAKRKDTEHYFDRDWPADSNL